MIEKDLRYVPQEEQIKEIGELVVTQRKCENCGGETAICVEVTRVEDPDSLMCDAMEGRGGEFPTADILYFDYQCRGCGEKFLGAKIRI